MEDAFTTPSVEASKRNGDGPPSPGEHPAGSELAGAPTPTWLAAAPVALVIVLLLVATVFHGAFEVRHWAPPALFVLLLLAAQVARRGGAAIHDRWIMLMLLGIWAFAAWTMLSALWSPSPSNAWHAGARDLLYAALVSIPAVTMRDPRLLRLAGYAIVVGIGAIASVTTIALLLDGPTLFLAGRLDAPVGYRNATALLFCLGVWPLLCIMATRNVRRTIRGLAFSAAALEVGLAFLTQSRGMLLGLVAGGIIAIGVGPDRVRRAWVAILLIVLVAAFSPVLLTPYDAFDVGRGFVTPEDISTAAWGLVGLAVAGFVVGLLIAIFDAGLRVGSLKGMHTTAAWALVALVFVGAAGALVKIGDPVKRIDDKWAQFTDLNSSATGDTRLTFAGGQRSDLWRVSLREFQREPLLGVGAGGYAFDYYRERHSDRNLDDPHSLPFQIIGELGLVGVLLFAAFLIGAGGAMARGWRRARPEIRRSASGLAAAGAVLLGQLTVDWMWLIPGVTGIGLFCLALASAMIASEAQPEAVAAPPPRRMWIVTRVAVVTALVLAALSVTVYFLGDLWVRDARAQAGRSSTKQLDAAKTAEMFNPLSVTPHYLQASALEEMGKRAAARQQLQEALDLEPNSAATLGLLGDFELRAGHQKAARAYYRRASELNPIDVGLRKLAGLPVEEP